MAPLDVRTCLGRQRTKKISLTMKRQFCCDASRFAYEDYYLKQSGSGMPVFQGVRMQRGHGLGSILSGFFRSA